MKAGRELDALVAEKVMAWSVCWPNYTPSEPLVDRPETIEPWVLCPNFSTEMTAAWEVVQKLWGPTCNFFIAGDIETNYWAATFVPRGPGNVCSANSETAAHAICLAALKAVGYKFEDPK